MNNERITAILIILKLNNYELDSTLFHKLIVCNNYD